MNEAFNKQLDDTEVTIKPFKAQVVWKNVCIMGALHLSSLYALMILHKAQFSTLLWGKHNFKKTTSY